MSMLSLIPEFLALQRNQWLSPEQLEQMQARKLRRLIRHAYTNVPFYRALFDSAGCSQDDVGCPGDLVRLPVVRKQDLQGAGDDALARNADPSRCTMLGTSGSDAAPFSLPFTDADRHRRVLMELRQFMANGFTPGERMTLIVSPHRIPTRDPWYQKLGILPRQYLSMYSSAEEQLGEIRRWQPRVLYGYTSALRILADAVLESGDSIPGIRLVTSGAEMMEPKVRRKIEKAFGVPPTDFYGTVETGAIAWQCPAQNGYHINSDYVIVECVRGGQPVGPEEEGEIVVTALDSSVVPMVRYSTGDLGVLSRHACSCGRGLPLIMSVR